MSSIADGIPPVPPDTALDLARWLEDNLGLLKKQTQVLATTGSNTYRAKIQTAGVAAGSYTCRLLNQFGTEVGSNITVYPQIELGANDLTGDIWPNFAAGETIDVFRADNGLWYTYDAVDDVQTSIDHGSDLVALSLLDDDHTQYALLAGRSGGQVLKGGTGSGDDLTFWTTSNATKGSYFLTDLTGNGFVKTSGGTGLLSIDTAAYITLASLSAVSPISYNNGTGAFSHIATAGNIHLPTGGSANQILKNSGVSGTGSWGTVTENAGALAAITTLSMSGRLTNTLADGGLSPFVITSTVVNTNLNADLWDGYQFADYLDQAVKQASSPAFAGLTVDNLNLDGAAITSDTGAISFGDENLTTTGSATTNRSYSGNSTLFNYKASLANTLSGTGASSIANFDLALTITGGGSPNAASKAYPMRNVTQIAPTTAILNLPHYACYYNELTLIGASYAINLTNLYGFHVNSALNLGTVNITNAYGFYWPAWTGASITNNWALYCLSGQSALVGNVRIGSSVAPTSALHFADAKDIAFDTTTGTKIGTATSQKLGFWNVAPIVQPTTAIAEAAFTENAGGTAVNVDSTFGGYTIQQVVKALQNTGLLA